MTSQRMARTEYTKLDLADPNQPRSGPADRSEVRRDMLELYRPLEQIHASGLHGWGVASGLEVAVSGTPAVAHVLPGIGLDSVGRHVALADGSLALLGAKERNRPPTPVPATGGVPVPVDGATGDQYLSIEWEETLDSQAASASPPVYRIDHTPRLQFMPVTGFVSDGARLVLARVTLDAAGAVSALSTELRRQAALPVGRIGLLQPQVGAIGTDKQISHVESASIAPRPTGGLDIAVSNPTDVVEIRQAGGGAFDKMVMAANSLVGRTADGKETVVMDTKLAHVTLGAPGSGSQFVAQDAQSRSTIVLDGSRADASVGVTGQSGDLYVRNALGQTAVHLAGQGNIQLTGSLQTADGTVAVNVPELATLFNKQYNNSHRHVSGNATQIYISYLFANEGAPAVATVTFPSKVRIFAFIALSSMDPLNTQDRGAGYYAEIYKIDGNDYRGGGASTGGDDLGALGADTNLRAAWYNGDASSVTFRLRSMKACTVWATGVVFGEWWG